VSRHVIVYGWEFDSWILQDNHSTNCLPRVDLLFSGHETFFSHSQSSFAGAGGGGLNSMMQIVISDIVSLRERCVALLSLSLTLNHNYRGKYQGIIGGVVAIGYFIGPPLGGALAQKVGWRVRVGPLVFTCIDHESVLFLGHNPRVLCRDMRGRVYIAFETRPG
jgi:MFS family permease